MAQIRRKTDYFAGRYRTTTITTTHGDERERVDVFFDRARIDNKAINGARSNFTRRNESEKRSLIFIAGIMDFITLFEERKREPMEPERGK